jgi:hypothetical protein
MGMVKIDTTVKPGRLLRGFADADGKRTAFMLAFGVL